MRSGFSHPPPSAAQAFYQMLCRVTKRQPIYETTDLDEMVRVLEGAVTSCRNRLNAKYGAQVLLGPFSHVSKKEEFLFLGSPAPEDDHSGEDLYGSFVKCKPNKITVHLSETSGSPEASGITLVLDEIVVLEHGADEHGIIEVKYEPRTKTAEPFPTPPRVTNTVQVCSRPGILLVYPEGSSFDRRS